jgi:hypothetical protein
MYASRVSILVVASLAASFLAQAGPVSSEDVRQERSCVDVGACQEKVRAISQLRFSGGLWKWVILSGSSGVQNKLAAIDLTLSTFPWNEPIEQLGGRQIAFALEVKARKFLAHHPANGKANRIDTAGRPHPEVYLTAEELKSGVNILTFLQTLDIPVCLSAVEVENYIYFRVECQLRPGDYWKQLHTGKYTDEQLAVLRYLDYLDANAPTQPVPVYHCTELTVLGKH